MQWNNFTGWMSAAVSGYVLGCTYAEHQYFASSLFQTTLSLVTMSTRTDWSKLEQTHKPCLSGLQSRLAIGWVDSVAFCNRLTEPATPTSTPFESFLHLWAGYSLEMTKHNRLQKEHDSDLCCVDLRLERKMNCLLFPEMQVACSPCSHEDVSVLRQMSHLPDGWLMSLKHVPRTI